MEINAIVLVGQVILSGILVYVALRKAPAERQTFDATAAAQYAQAAKTKGEENERLQKEIDEMNTRLLVVERKKYRVILEFTIGDHPEMGRVTIEPIIDLQEDVIPKLRRKRG